MCVFHLFYQSFFPHPLWGWHLSLLFGLTVETCLSQLPKADIYSNMTTVPLSFLKFPWLAEVQCHRDVAHAIMFLVGRLGFQGWVNPLDLIQLEMVG